MKAVLFQTQIFHLNFPILGFNNILLNKKACLINWVLQFYLYKVLFLIFWIPF